MIEIPGPAGKLQTPDEVLDGLRYGLLDTLRDLVRIPSENLPPNGNELTCQMHVAERLRRLRFEPDVYLAPDVAGLTTHPEFWPGRDYAGRPNVNAVWKGAGGGRSLILSGHIDTVPADTPVEWRHPPFGAAVESGRLFGRGAWDMKAGVAMNLTVLQALRTMGARLKGDLIFETVVDEEFGGVNGTLAARLRGYHADAAVVSEPTSLRICPAQRGGRTLHILLRGEGGILSSEQQPGRAVEQLAYVLAKIPEFRETRKRRVAVHPYYMDSPEPFAVWVTNIATGRWGWSQPISVPEICRLEIYWQAMPEETREEVESEFFTWWNQTLDQRPDLFPRRPVVELPMRWLPGCAIPPDAPLVREFAQAAAALGRKTKVEGMDAPSDMYVFQRCFDIPAIMWGPAGGNAHQADEFVELDSLLEAARVLLLFVCRWCGMENGGS
ncbi:MAG: M20/M25/M40 family metallo-hydrolase [Bryobacterales bacterium]|nr:M20/M25/M40 family metallo-hydrolase [Bryobacterales bacterium]